MKKYLVLTLALAMTFTAGNALAFHSGGVAECEGCHTMHNSKENAPVGQLTQQFEAGPYLLVGTDASSACLDCHNGPTLSSYHVSSVDSATNFPQNLTPGGDFSWLSKTYSFTTRGTSTALNAGERHGHNIVAADFGYAADSTLTTAPGSGDAVDAGKLGCSGCHDPHSAFRRDSDGNVVRPIVGGAATDPIIGSGSYDTSADPKTWGAVGVYRLLAGNGYSPKSFDGAVNFTVNPPDAVAPSSYNRVESTTQTIVAYGQGMSEWCATCHADIHLTGAYTSGTAGLRHPAGNDAKLTAAVAANYKAYKKSGDFSNLAANASYNSLVPFELGTSDYAALKAFAGTTLSDATDPTVAQNVNCLSCHRAHASGFAHMLRFPYAYEFMTLADTDGVPTYEQTGSGTLKQGYDTAQYTQALYNRPATQFAPYQRVLCNKCHAKD